MAQGYGTQQNDDSEAVVPVVDPVVETPPGTTAAVLNRDAATEGGPGKQGGAGGKGGGEGTQWAQGGGKGGGEGGGKGGGSPQSQGGSWWGGSADQWTGTPGDIWGDNTAGVAGSNPMLDFGNQQIWDMQGNNRYTLNSEGAINNSITAGMPQMEGANTAYQTLTGGHNPYESKANDAYSKARIDAMRRISGDTIANDPAVAAANETFQNAMAPMIQNASALSGLGRSTAMTNALSSQQAATMLPLVQQAMAREERGLQGEVQTGLAAGQGYAGLGRDSTGRIGMGAQGQANLANMQGQRQANAAQMFAGLQGQQQSQLMDQINSAMGSGQYGRGMVQEGLDASYNEFLRKSGMFEGATEGPLGAIGGLIGSTAEGKKA